MSDIFKRLITVVLILLGTSLFGQQVNLDWFDLNCGMNFDPVEHPEYKMDLGQTGGQHIISFGTLRESRTNTIRRIAPAMNTFIYQIIN